MRSGQRGSAAVKVLAAIAVVVGVLGLVAATVGALVAVRHWRARGRAPAMERPSAAGQLRAPGEAQCEAFARELERSVNAGDGSFLDGSVDFTVLMDRTLGGRRFPARVVKEHTAQVAGAFDHGSRLAGMVERGGRFTFLRLRHIDGEARVLFRMLLDNCGSSYYDFVLVERNGQVAVADSYTLTTGECWSDGMRRILLPLLTEQCKTPLAKALTREAELARHVNKLEAMLKAGDPDRVLALYRQLPVSLQRNKSILFIRLVAASKKGWASPEYAAALDDFKAWFSSDPGANAMLIDHYFLRKEYAKARECIDAVVEAIGPDASTRRGSHSSRPFPHPTSACSPLR